MRLKCLCCGSTKGIGYRAIDDGNADPVIKAEVCDECHSWVKIFYQNRDTALEAVADQAIHRGTGARGLRAIMEEVLLPVMYDIPSRDDVAKVVVTKETVQDNVLPTIVPRKPSRTERRDKSA